MGNSPSADLGGGSAPSSRAVRTTNPEMEVKRSSASRAPTHNEYNELPASSKPLTGTRTWGPEVRDSSQVPNSRINANSNTVPVYEEVQVPTCSSSTSIQRGAWKSENSLFDRPSPSANSPEVRPAVRPTALEAIRPGTTEVQPELREDDAKDQQNFIQKFDADPTEKFDQSNLNRIEGLSKQFTRFDQVTLTRTPLKFDRAEPTRTA